jgi:hypothetical protein
MLVTQLAWTGGSTPAKPSATHGTEYTLASVLFRDQLADWEEYWGEFPPRDLMRTFWRRARLDAHASIRHHPAYQ